MESNLKPREAPKEQRTYRNASCKPLQTRAEQCMNKRASGQRELVKYMSKLPGFLERTETPQDKLLNVGVLNWGRLENWQHSLRSVSEMHASEALSTDESSVHPRKVQAHSSAHQKNEHDSLQIHLVSNPPKEGSQITKSYDDYVKECQNRKTIRENNFKDHRCFGTPDEQPCRGTAAPVSDRCDSKNYAKICSKSETLSSGLKPVFGLNVETKSKARKDRRGKQENTFKVSSQNDHEGEVGQKLLGASELHHHSTDAKTRSRRSSTKEDKEVCQVEFDYSKRHSCSLSSDADKFRGAQVKREMGSSNVDRNTVLVVPLSGKASASSSRDKFTEGKSSASLSMKESAGEPARGRDSKLCDATSETGRNISPFQRLASNTGRTSKCEGERYAVSVTQLKSTVNSTKSGSRHVATSSGIDNSDNKKSGGKGRAEISPFRRLLEPLLKPKATHPCNSSEDPGVQQVQRVKLGINGCKTVSVNDSAHEKRLLSSMVHAVLRVTVKNDQLLFTFAVNKESEILAATVKKLGSTEGNECTAIYNLFSIQEHKKNGAWLNQRGKGQTHGIISNVFAQMRVSSSPSGSIREFVLFSVDLGHGNEEKSDLQLKNELAAIVIKMPRRLNSSVSRNTVQKRDHPEEWNSAALFDQDISATVILQSGVHSLPHKGGPSSLIQRWRSGGSCDCGGWDMGCNLRVLSNRPSKNPAPAPSSEPLELFSLGGQPEEQPFLSFIPMKEGIYRVGYNSSLSPLQAFSICIAVAETRKLSGTIEEKSSHNERVPFQDEETKCNGTAEEEVAARYVAYPPPLSPVGRV